MARPMPLAPPVITATLPKTSRIRALPAVADCIGRAEKPKPSPEAAVVVVTGAVT